jgi:phospholipid-binding lipoprotein MlaA
MRQSFRSLGTVLRNALFAVAVAGIASGCATLPEDPLDRADVLAVNDPFEPANRMVFAINETVDLVLLRPVAVLYRDFMPAPGKELVFNFVRHITLPLTIVNDVAQGEWDRAEIAAKRLFVNTIAGFGGVVDAATGLGLPHHKEDFGQTLATYQVVPGPYIVLPLIGPSSTRHAFGRVVDVALDPLTYLLAKAPVEATLGMRAVSIVDQRYRLLGPLDDLKKNSLDYYAAVRSLYRQRRTYEIRNLGDEATSRSTADVFNVPFNREG